MSIVKWSPFKELEDMRRDMAKLFGEFFEPSPMRGRLWPKLEIGVIVPNVNMYDRKNEIVGKAELPGVEKENVDITITENNLTIRGERKKDEEVKEEDYYSREMSYGSFTRTISLPVEVDSSKAKATFKSGILEIALPKKEEAKPKEIKVELS